MVPANGKTGNLTRTPRSCATAGYDNELFAENVVGLARAAIVKRNPLLVDVLSRILARTAPPTLPNALMTWSRRSSPPVRGAP
jgi:hypothetical protein